jgi:ABC-type nitrate/sulfonate/bicarbonate transport system substrate-binding protein
MNAPTMTRARASALLFGSALCSLAIPGRAQTNPTIRVAVQPIENAMEVYYAKETGRFAAAGLDVDIQIVPAVGSILAAVASNAVDIGYGSVDALAEVHQRNIPLIVIAAASEYLSPASQRISALALPANSPVRQAKDLDGKIVATGGLRSIGESVVRTWVDQNGGDSSTIKFVEIPFPAEAAALDAGRVDAAWLPEPFLSSARGSTRVLSYAFDSVSKHFLLSAFCTSTEWAKNHPALVDRFASVIRETAVWANKNPDLTAPIVARTLKLDPSIVGAMARTRYAEQLTPSLLQPLIDVSAKFGGYNVFPAQELIYSASH